MSVTIYGASDDLIEIEGDIREEFTYQDLPEGNLLAFSDGTILRITYTDQGFWRINKVHPGSADLTIDQAPEDEEDNYSDRATLKGKGDWVVQGISVAHNILCWRVR